MLLHYENVIKVSNRKIDHFRLKIILYYYTKKSSLDKNGRFRKSRNTVDRLVYRLYPLETNFKFVIKDSELNKVQEVMKEGTCRPKREAAALAKVRIRYAPGIN